MNLDSESSPWKYLPFELGECEDLENYGPGGFHPVHLSDVYDDQYRVVHKLGFGGFSTVWLARNALTNQWVALKIVAARESPTYEARSVIASHPSIAGSRLFAVVDRPNGRHPLSCVTGSGPELVQAFPGHLLEIKTSIC